MVGQQNDGHTADGIQFQLLGKFQADRNHCNDLVAAGKGADKAVDKEYNGEQNINALVLQFPECPVNHIVNCLGCQHNAAEAAGCQKHTDNQAGVLQAGQNQTQSLPRIHRGLRIQERKLISDQLAGVRILCELACGDHIGQQAHYHQYSQNQEHDVRHFEAAFFLFQRVAHF